MLNTGLRSGEALALRNDDFDFEAHTVRIERNAVQVKKRDRHSRAQGGYDLRIQTPKTRARRDTIKWGRGTNGSRGAWRRLCVFRGKTRSPLRIPIRKQKAAEWRLFVLAGAQRLELWTRGFGDREKSPKNRINTRFF